MKMLNEYEDMLLDRNGIANILSLSKIKSKLHIIYNSARQDAFEVHNPNLILLFCKYKNGLHYHGKANMSVVK
eukprot:2049496-Ditylum_brightwellii.AAC.1